MSHPRPLDLSLSQPRPLGLSLSKVLLGIAASLPLAACSPGDVAPKVAEGGEHIACALGEGAAFAETCAVERGSQDGKALLVVRHPDGAFRRFTVERDGLALADGAEAAQVSASASLLEVAVGPDRYRIPFAVKADAVR